jgi:hypothetical protein
MVLTGSPINARLLSEAILAKKKVVKRKKVSRTPANTQPAHSGQAERPSDNPGDVRSNYLVEPHPELDLPPGADATLSGVRSLKRRQRNVN